MSVTIFSILSEAGRIDPLPILASEYANLDDDAVLFDRIRGEWCFVKRVFKYDDETRGTYYNVDGRGLARPAKVGDVVLCYFSDVAPFANHEDLFIIVPFEWNRFYYPTRNAR